MKLEPAQQLHVAGRVLAIEGELRVSLLRVCLIIAFYSAQLVSFLGYSSGVAAEANFHRQATYPSATWLFASLAVVVMISRRQWPAWCKYVSSTLDILLLSIMASAGNGPASPLVMVYVLIVLLAGLRGSLPLIWFTTIGSLLAYMTLLIMHGQSSGSAWLASLKTVQLKPIDIMISLLTIGSAGVVTGQLVRMIKQVLLEVSARSAVASATSDSSAQQAEARS